MDYQTFKQTVLTPSSIASSLFTGDVFDMKGGKYENQDLRLYLLPYLHDPDAELLLINKPKDDEFGGFQTMARVSRTKEEPVTLYDPTGLIEESHPLTRQQGHKTVSSLKDTNRLWNGKFVIEYDLVDCNKRGKKYLFMDGPSLSEATFVRKDNEDDSYLDDALDTDDEEFVRMVKRRIDPNILNADKGPIVSGSTLLTEIKILAELFKEETESEEKTGGLDPVMRKLLLPEGFPKDKPMFDVAFLTNVMTMGFKAVFYPTALNELSSSSEGVDAVKLNALLAAQTELLVRAMPRIVASVNRTLSEKKCVKYFKIDTGGTKNLSLPANVKADELAMPYHQFKIHENGVVEISNKELVTSLGVKKRHLVSEWLNELGVFERKCKYAAAIGRGGDKLDNNEWKRKLLFSWIADTLPFKYRTDFIDLDYYVSGLCFSFLSSEYGMSIDYDPDFVTSVINHTGGPMTTDGRSKVGGGNIVGYSSSEVVTEGGSSTAENSDDEHRTTAFLASNDIARSRAPPNPLPLPSDAPKRIYDSLLGSTMFYRVFPALREDNNELGMITEKSSEEYASVIINLLTAKTKTDRKHIADTVFKRKMLLIQTAIGQRILDTSGESEYYMAVAYAILQMVVRHIIRDRGVGFDSPEFNQVLSSMKWAKLDLDYLWKSLYMESINRPSPEMDEAIAVKYAEVNQKVDRSVKDSDRLMEIIDEINDVRETDEIVALRNKTVETIGDGHDCYPFASSAYGHDTMFLWTVVTLAERFCQLYNAVNNPEEYYKAMISEENKLSFEGGEENFKNLCSRLKSELQIFLCGSDGEHTFVCRPCVEKSEREFETNKNRVNKELFLIKKKELEMSTPSTISEPIARGSMTPEEVYRYKADTDKLCRDMFDVILEVEAEAAREEEGECSSDDENYESCGEDDAFSDEEPSLDKDAVMEVERKVVQERLKEDVINGFFNRYAEVRSFKSRSALCHRQKYISVNSLLVTDKLLSGYVVTPKIVKYQDDHACILEEVRSRSKRGKGWVVPYTFPVDKLTGSNCCCCEGGVKLLVVPDSYSVRQLTTALRFNTMACERRFFTDVSTSLGFVPQADAHPPSSPSSSFFFNTDNSKYCDFYENIIKVQEDLRSCLLPRFRARYAAERYDSSMKNLEGHTSFFAGLWAICAKANLENTVLSAVVSCPQEASYTLKGNSNAANNDSMAKHVARAVEAIGTRKQTSIVKTFLEFAGCVDLVSMDKKTTTPIEADQDFYLKLVKTYRRANDCNGTHLWSLFSVMKRCFDNSLPLDWRKLLGNNRHLNLVPNAPNTDESGALFETARFISRCSELTLGKARRRLKECITREEWRDLLTGNGWSSKIALVYEKVMNTNDSRTTENFINSSTFLSNNNVSKKISINETKNEKIRQACWSSGESSLSVDERINLLMAVERTNRDMTLSTVMMCCALYRLLVEGCRVEDITNKESENFGNFIPFLKSLSIVTATWNNSAGGGELNPTLEYNNDNLIEVCARNGRFVDIENDPVFFYRFAAYTLGMLANNDQFFEDLTGTITESLDFNGVDTRNWNDFIEKHFLSVLLGRRAFLVSRPSAFIKRMVGSSNDEKNNSESVRRLAKLMMVKAVDANDLTLSDLVLCCIEDDKEDFVVRSAEEYQNKFHRLGKKMVKETNATDSAMSSNACSNEQMSKKVKASRPQDVRVYFNKKSDIKAIERNEEEEADLSYGMYTDTVEKAVIKPERGGGAGAGGDGAGSGAGGCGGGDDSSLAGERKRKSRQRNNQCRENDTKNFNGRTEDIYDHSNREDTSGTMSGFIAASNSMDGSAFMREKDVKFRKDTDFTEDDLIIANDNIVKRARKLMRQDKIKESICQMIDSMSEGLRIVCPFNSHDDPSLLGLSRTAANRVIDTVRAWNAIVAREAVVFKEECKEIEKSCTYDMRLVLCGDYTSEGINSGFGDEVHVFKTPLFDIVSAEGKRKSDVIIEVDIKKTSKPQKKKYNNEDEGPPVKDRDCPEPPKDAVRTVNSDTLGDIAAFKKCEESNDAYCQRFIGFGDGPQGNGILFKQRLHGNKILDPSLVAHFFSSNLIDPYMRSVVPRLMQHNAEHEGKVSLKRPTNASEKNGDGSEGGGSGKKKGGDDRVNMFAFSSLNIIRTYSDLSRLKQCANENNSNLVSLYDNVSREQQVNGVSDIITKEDVRIPIRRGTVNGEEDYASVKALWLCNSGIHPRDQIEMFKKMVFRNYNKIWIKMYSEAMNVFRKWGVLTRSTIDRPFFSAKFTTMPVQVVDNNPPNAVLHSKFLSKDVLADRVSSTNSMVKLREYYLRSVGITSIERFRNISTPLENINTDILDRAILCREFMTSMYDNRGSFATSKFTNAATFVFTPGTSVEGRDYRGMGYAKDEDFVGKEEMLCTNSFNLCYGSIVSALRYGVFEDTTSKSLEGGRNRVLRLYDNDMVLSSKSGSVNVVRVSNEASKRKSESIMKRAAKDTIKDSNHTTRVRQSVYGHLTTHYSVINDNYNARNMLMSIRRVDRAAVENAATNNNNKNKSDEEKNRGADDLSLRYILGRYRGYVFYADDFPSEQKHSNYLTLLKKCFGAIRDRNVNKFAIFSKEWLALSIVPEITRSARMASKIKSCIRIDRRIDVGADITFDDLAPKNKNRDSNTNLRRSINRSDASVGFEKRGVSFLANPVVSMRWFLMRAHHLRLCCTNFGVASLSNFMGNRENKSTPMDVPPSAKSLATVFKMKAARNSCISVDNNRFFLIGGSYVLGGRLEGVNLITDMFVRCKLQTEKQIVHEALFDANVTTGFLAACMEGTAITRGISMIEHISRLTNVTAGDSKSKNFWSLPSPHNRKKEETQFEYCYAGDASPVVRPPSVCIDDDNYVFLRMLYSVVSEMEVKKRGATASKVDRHVAAAIKKSYVEVLNQKNGLPNMHSLFHLRSIMNFCGFVNGICTGDGEKAHHLMHTLSAVGINMTPKTVLAFIGVVGNNLKSSLVNIVKAGWWDMYTDLSADALVGKGDSSSTDAKFAYVAGKKNIFIMEEVGYQGSVKEKKSHQSGAGGGGGGGGCADAPEDKMSFLDSINTRNIEVASSLWNRVSKRLKDNNMRLCESQTARNGSLMALGKKRARDEEEDEEEEVLFSTEKRTNDKKEKDNKSPMINMFSNKVGWWSHIKGPVFSEIGREKAISCIISNSEVPFCTLSKNIIDNSPWVRETDSILVNHRDIESKLTLYTPILTPPAAVGKGAKEDVGGEENMGVLDLISASMSSSSASYQSTLNASEIKEECLNLIKKEPSNNSFRPFSKMKELLMSVGYNADNEWFIDEKRCVLTPRRTSASEAAANAANASTCPAIFAMHAFSPFNYSQSIFKGFRKYYLDEPGEDVIKRIGSRLSKPRKAAKAMYSDHQLKQTTEQTIAHIIKFPGKYSFPAMTVDGSDLFPIKPEASSRIVERFVRLNKTNLRGGKICKEIAAISELASSSFSNGQQQSSSSVFLSQDSFNVHKGTYETNGTDVNFLDLMKNTGSNNNKLNVRERIFAAALENCDNSKTGTNVTQESNLASSRMNRDSPFTEEMLPGQVSSNLVKQVASTDSIMSVRGLHGRPITCSVSGTPVMISNSFLLRYYVDTAMYKRMLIFPFDTNFAPRNIEPNVELGDKIVRTGLKVIHASLLCERSNLWSTQ
uniref:Wsv343-like protein n=1 Tax=Hemigrapsus takanoi nimavirus TaxID=2133792 RepID=A0A401IP30_9VIRU|nr:wsv343-like protein [Hemigrapsus takanoi nimavirus]